MARRCMSWLVPLTVAAGMLFVVTAGAYAAPGSESSGRMTVNTGGQFVTLASTRVTAAGQLRNQWTVGAARVTVTAPAGSTVTLGPGTVDVAPAMAVAGEATAARSARIGRGVLAHAAWTNPCDHCWYNSLSNSYCLETCVYASSDQYALQEVSGAWYMGQHITGTVYPGSGSAELGEAYNRFPGESGDSGPLNYNPSGDDCPSSGATWSWGFSGWGFSFGESGPLAGNSCYGPIAPSSWGDPAFGSRWWSGGESGNHSIGSFDAIHLGSGQDPYDELDLGVS
jgi:hypothetical protein